jgi:hypothetical protein
MIKKLSPHGFITDLEGDEVQKCVREAKRDNHNVADLNPK